MKRTNRRLLLTETSEGSVYWHDHQIVLDAPAALYEEFFSGDVLEQPGILGTATSRTPVEHLVGRRETVVVGTHAVIFEEASELNLLIRDAETGNCLRFSFLPRGYDTRKSKSYSEVIAHADSIQTAVKNLGIDNITFMGTSQQSQRAGYAADPHLIELAREILYADTTLYIG